MTSPATLRAPRRKLKAAMLLLAAGFAVAAASTAGASPTDSAVATDAVYYSPASLVTESGVQSLYHRIAHAAWKVCENQQMSGTRLPSDAELQCRRHAIDEAVEKVHNTRLATLAASHTKSG